MKKLLFPIGVFLFVSNVCLGTVRRVGYPGTPKANVDYTNVQEAHDAASNNDTIQIYGNVHGGNITKPLVFIGFGYNFDANTGLQAIGIDVPSATDLGFYVGSNGSVVNGLYGNFTIEPWDFTTYVGGEGVSNITFQRCMGDFNLHNYAAENIGFDGGPISNIKIFDCVVKSCSMAGASYNMPVTNVQIYNSIIFNVHMSKTGSSIAIINCVNNSYQPEIAKHDAGALIKNCILGNSNYQANSNTIYENNFFGDAKPNTAVPGTNNRWGQDFQVLFTRNGLSDDLAGHFGNAEFDEDYYVLKSGSPAKNGGFNAANQPTDFGIYGGEAAYAYKLSGVPAVPAIYKLTAPALNAGSNPYNVTISVRSNN